ncbi:hypothetical protein MIR68_000555 [Amoeboaphelidium protococcarum]|nr:hypothetical protein MIR68_000555 [Amoeboaphelidium protococcarum]
MKHLRVLGFISLLLSQLIQAGSFAEVPSVVIRDSPVIIKYCSRNFEYNPNRLRFVIKKYAGPLGFMRRAVKKEVQVETSAVKYIGPADGSLASFHECFEFAINLQDALDAFVTDVNNSGVKYKLIAKTESGMARHSELTEKAVSSPFTVVKEFDQLKSLSQIATAQVDNKVLVASIEQSNKAERRINPHRHQIKLDDFFKEMPTKHNKDRYATSIRPPIIDRSIIQQQ